jgi:phytoene dehydrogenase-like protein
VLFDTTPPQLLRIAGDRIPSNAYRRFRPAPAPFKLDYALDGPIPWTNEAARRAGTVHLGGTWQEVAAAEEDVHKGRVAERPFVLVAQQSGCDDTRAPAGQHTLWAYCHVPNGCTKDVTDTIEAQFDRAAPGWRDLVLATHVMGPADYERYNENNAGGDFIGGSNAGLRWLFRPRIALDPYRSPAPNLWLCSASTPPGAGVHGMPGWHAAGSVLRHL